MLSDQIGLIEATLSRATHRNRKPINCGLAAGEVNRGEQTVLIPRSSEGLLWGHFHSYGGGRRTLTHVFFRSFSELDELASGQGTSPAAVRQREEVGPDL